MITGWGANTRYKKVHYFRDIDGRPACAIKHKSKGLATIALKNWDPDHPHTCPKCRKLYEKIAVVSSIGRR